MKRILMAIGISLLCVLAFLGWQHRHDAATEKGLYAPNVTWSTSRPLPCPPFCDEQKNEKAMSNLVQNATKNDRQILKTNHVIVVPDSDTEALRKALHKQISEAK